MSSRYQTQCPRCHTIYPMPESKLGEEKARANCGKCHHTFFLNLHLINPSTTAPVNAPTSNDDNLSLPAVPTRKKSPVTETDGMIFDDMDSDDKDNDISFNDADLSDFLKQDFENPINNTQKTADDDEAWLDELLKNDDSPSIATTPISKRPKDDLSDIIGVDINSYIPEAAAQESSEDILKKVNDRLSSHAPTQEQMLTKRSFASRLPYVVGSLLMIGLLGVQYAFFNQDVIAKDPAKASLVHGLCGFCGFNKAEPTAFTANYELTDGSADHTTNLIANIKNNSSDTQLQPNLKITVMGETGLIGDLALTPKEYLATEQHLLSPTQSSRFMLTLDAPKEAIKSINIEPFY